MKRIIFNLLVLISVFFMYPFFNVKAQVPTGTSYNITIPGTNCGIPEDTEKNKCCNFYRPDFTPQSLPEGLGALAPLFTSGGKDLVNKQIINPIDNLAKNLQSPCLEGVPSTNDVNDVNCKCIYVVTPQPENLIALSSFCQNQSKVQDRTNCMQCANDGGVWSGIGCVKTNVQGFIQDTLFGLGIGLAGGLSLLCIIYAAFMMQSSQGNPEKLKKAQEMITSCIMGLMLIIFSVFILRLIGVNILKIPGFS
jgi:hypothetical protein